MERRINLTAIFLVLATVIFGGLSFFIALKLKEEKPGSGNLSYGAKAETINSSQTKPANVTYEKLLVLNVPTITPTTIPPTETPSPTKPQTVIPSLPTPTQIQLVTTPSTTPSQLLAYTTATPTATLVVTKQPVVSLPQSGIYNIPLFLFLGALTLIVFSFIL